ncbi:GATA transcription factor 4-like [Aristolochia californica]|uniref:GATA transcription factor 4-like n=1 Tax=Aristolochia californica TaxID=171875 RepID=UPI0035E19889
MSSERETGIDCFYGHPSDFLRIDGLLDFSNVEISDPDVPYSSAVPLPESCKWNRKDVQHGDGNNPLCGSFSDEFCLPSEDVAELEWLSKFVDDSFSDLPLCAVTGNETGANANFWPDTGVPGRARSKRSRAAATTRSWISFPSTAESETPALVTDPESSIAKAASRKKENSPSGSVPTEGVLRKCTHCATEKTPQWRTGPMGPKSLCNACGVRYKSGRLVPEYRPAASPSFVLTQHSNSHRKVMELRRQKELLKQEKFLQDFKVCSL